ncbi:uncharacterized protein GGS22DRAFT_161537 [Annulohypoxylon maeteangense]|uniref:uncharacterized protein n=1 Tax=Annulohypoxylon maeteangense TaxID=1927788 RepID=UPI00200844FD|nr:uncharacterized protein GGS22DRAFT_161537 [Annulohypoxylon maeteangense]KAI0885662.1 hypothetical protein GGS22DRAFT_161537 [Annulohypoxylon maeteangense]
MLVKPGVMGANMSSSASIVGDASSKRDYKNHRDFTAEEKLMARRKDEDETREAERIQSRGAIFDGVVVYINGSTHPLISDHKLKHVLAQHGARTSINLGRRQVTHVILGRSASGSGAGGGLAGGKLQKEIQKVGGCGVKFVGAEWVIESIKAGKRLPEAKFSNLKIASKGQQSVYGLYSKPKASAEPSTTQ